MYIHFPIGKDLRNCSPLSLPNVSITITKSRFVVVVEVSLIIVLLIRLFDMMAVVCDMAAVTCGERLSQAWLITRENQTEITSELITACYLTFPFPFCYRNNCITHKSKYIDYFSYS